MNNGKLPQQKKNYKKRNEKKSEILSQALGGGGSSLLTGWGTRGLAAFFFSWAMACGLADSNSLDLGATSFPLPLSLGFALLWPASLPLALPPRDLGHQLY